jgi:hypothetical protein
VCTMCAPRDQRKSGNNQHEQVEQKALRSRWRADVLGGVISSRAVNLRRQLPRFNLRNEQLFERTLLAQSRGSLRS